MSDVDRPTTDVDRPATDVAPPATDVDALVEAIGDVRDRLVVLDFDGTLSPIVDDPDAAQLADGAREAIDTLSRITDVAVLSGRHVDDLAPRVDGLAVTLAGGHGTELRTPDGIREPLFDRAAVRDTLDGLEADLRALVDQADGWVVEPKPASLAVHDRRVPDEVREELLPRVREVVRARADEPPGWEVLAGKAVTELRPRGIDKGTALDLLVERLRGRPLVIGDDVTDEDAFRAARRHADGLAVLVADAPRDTAATWRVPDPDAVVTLLRRLAAPA